MDPELVPALGIKRNRSRYEYGVARRGAVSPDATGSSNPLNVCLVNDSSSFSRQANVMCAEVFGSNKPPYCRLSNDTKY